MAIKSFYVMAPKCMFIDTKVEDVNFYTTGKLNDLPQVLVGNESMAFIEIFIERGPQHKPVDTMTAENMINSLTYMLMNILQSHALYSLIGLETSENNINYYDCVLPNRHFNLNIDLKEAYGLFDSPSYAIRNGFQLNSALTRTAHSLGRLYHEANNIV